MAHSYIYTFSEPFVTKSKYSKYAVIYNQRKRKENKREKKIRKEYAMEYGIRRRGILNVLSNVASGRSFFIAGVESGSVVRGGRRSGVNSHNTPPQRVARFMSASCL